MLEIDRCDSGKVPVIGNGPSRQGLEAQLDAERLPYQVMVAFVALRKSAIFVSELTAANIVMMRRGRGDIDSGVA